MNPVKMIRKLYKKLLAPSVNTLHFRELISRTANFSSIKWLGHPVWQNVLDLWTIQETIAEVKPSLLIETGTNRGGSSLFYAQLFDLMGKGEVITIDVEKLHSLNHPRITYLIGSSTSEEILRQVQKKIAELPGPVMVILDSDHSQKHVARELECYTPLVTPGSFCLVQDGVTDLLPEFSTGRPGPLPAIEDFLNKTRLFDVDEERCSRFLISHHPKGWLKRNSLPGETKP
jgi:cephalosporin hydroxylase